MFLPLYVGAGIGTRSTGTPVECPLSAATAGRVCDFSVLVLLLVILHTATSRRIVTVIRAAAGQ